MPQTLLPQTTPVNKSTNSKRVESSVAALAAACSYRRPRSSYANWAWCPKRKELPKQ